MEWLLLLLVIGAEVAATTFLKISEGLTKLPPTVAMFGFYILSFGALSLTLEKIPVSIAYAVWSGVGTAMIALIGFMWFKEPVTAFKLVFIGLILVGAVGLNLVGEEH